jgi:hypothetical protein
MRERRENHSTKLRVRTTVMTSARASRFMLASLYVAALSLASCSGQMGLSGAVRDNFASRMTCPPDQVNVVQRSDIPRHTFFSEGEASPPPDVAADPNRLRFWQQEREARMRDHDVGSFFGGCDVFEVAGCGQRQVLCCAKHREGDTVFTNADCREQPSSNPAAAMGGSVSVVIAAPATAPMPVSSGQPAPTAR